MRRLPIYFLIDVSESMVGQPIEQVQDGMRTIIQDLRVNPYALETVFVSIIGFAGKAHRITELTELYKFYPPKFPIGGGTSLASALNLLMDDMDRSLVRTTATTKGDWKPIVFLFTDGNPTDGYQDAFRRWNERYRNRCNLVAISLGDNVNMLILGQLTGNILRLKETDRESYAQFFKWVSASISAGSQSVAATGDDDFKLPSTGGINLEKVELPEHPEEIDECWKADDNFVVLHGRCSNTGSDYLVKFGNTDEADIFGESHGDRLPGRRRKGMYSLIGSYPIDGAEYARYSAGKGVSVNTSRLMGFPSCPCCGNLYGVVLCECGNIFCINDDGHGTCPWCKTSVSLNTEGGGGGFDITRGLG